MSFVHANLTQDLEKYFQQLSYRKLTKITLINDDKIFVSIPSYRDPECSKTIQNLIDKAKDPVKLVIVVCQQNSTDDEDCLSGVLDMKGAEIKVKRLLDSDAKGPCWARFLIQQEWQGEEYYLQIDSHMRFVKDWDQRCRDELAKCPANSCLSTIPARYSITDESLDDNPLRGPMYVSGLDYLGDGFFQYSADPIISADKPLKSRGYAACFSFSSSKIMHDAPYDPYTPFLFYGEEPDIHARLFTRGWRVYAPSQPICFTTFYRKYRHTFWENPHCRRIASLSRLRIRYRLSIDNWFSQINLYPSELLYSVGTSLEYFASPLPKLECLLYDIKDYQLGSQGTFTEFLTYSVKGNPLVE